MTGELSPEQGKAFKNVTPIEAGEMTTRRHRRVQSDMGERALFIDGFTVLDQPETGFSVLEKRMKSAIIGQDQAIDAIITAMDRSRVRLVDDPRPKATLAFLGPTGVGKSETAKVLADYISGGNPRLIKIDCSNFSHGHEVSSLVGSPLGYVGHDKKPLLEKKKVERHGTVVLFDEIEKGSPELYNLMLQILGDGQLQLNDGSVANFRETTIILTSNLGAKEMNYHLDRKPVGFGVEKEEPSGEILSKSATEAFKAFFAPEFVNRIDATISFNPLNREGLGRILDNKLAAVNEQYSETYGMAIGLTDGAQEYLVDKALQERGMGARPLVRGFEKEIQSTFGRYISGQQLYQGSQLYVYHSSECPEEVRTKFPNNELIFTQRFDQALWEQHEDYKREQEEERRRIEEARKRAEQEAAAEQANEEPDGETPPDSDNS